MPSCSRIYRSFSTQESLAEIPPSVMEIMQRALALNYIPYALNQLTVQYYPSGSGIPSHIDRHSIFDSCVFCLSIGSHAVMDFEKKDVNENGVMEVVKSVSIPLVRRSLLVIIGEARYRWHHRIRERHTDIMADGKTAIRGDRISLTMRRIPPPNPCPCEYDAPFCN